MTDDNWWERPPRALDGLRENSGRQHYAEFDAVNVAAGNLIAKAIRSFGRQQDDTAERYLRRACSYPYDQHEGRHPGPLAAQDAILNNLTALVQITPAGEDTWLEVALDVWRSSTGIGKRDLADLLYLLATDALPVSADLDDTERSRIIRAVGERPLNRPPDLAADASVEEQMDLARELVQISLALQTAYIERRRG